MGAEPTGAAGAGPGADPAAGRTALGAATGLICLPALAFALGQALLLAGGHIATGPAIVILLAATAASLWAAWRAAGGWMAPAGVLAIVILAAAASGVVYDTSYDGQEYQYDGVAALAQGWNPYRTPTPVTDIVEVSGPLEIWVAHYPQGAWIVSALEVAAGVPPEAAKSQNLLVLGALFLAVLGAMQAFGFGGVRALAAAAMAAANPVLIDQLFSRMNDGLLGACLGLAAIFAALWLQRPSWWSALSIAAALVMALNLKFSGLPLAVGVCGLICLAALWRRGWRTAARAGAGLAVIGLFGVLVLGAHPYLTNTLRNGHPFYPLMGEGAVDIMAVNRPFVLRGLRPAERIVASYLSATSTGYVGGDRLKAPFTLSRSELRLAGEYDPRLGGFGPLFSGALALALLLAAAAGFSARRQPPSPVVPLLATAAGALVLGLIMPEAWWARYVPQVWWATALVAVAAMLAPDRRLRIGGGVLTAVLLANAALVAASSALYVGERNLDIRRQLGEIAAAPAPVCLHLGPVHARLALLGELKPKVRLQADPMEGADCEPLAGTSSQALASICPCP